MDSQCGFCGCVELLTAFKLHFCIQACLLQDMIRGLKLFSALQRLIFYQTCRLRFAINVFLRSFTAGLYVVTKGNSLSLFFCFCFSPDQCLESRLTPDNDLWFRIFVCFEFARHSSNVFFFNGVFSNQSYFFAFNETSFYPRRVERGKVYILKGFSRLIVRFDVQ